MKVKLNLFVYFINKYFNYNSVKYYSQSKNLFNKTEINFKNWEEELERTMQVLPNFITVEEEKSLMEEIDSYVRRLKYEQSHWDDAIHNYRETEKGKWNDENAKVINRIREKAFSKDMSQISLIHVLDLAPEGWIKPHVDSIRFCGEIITGLSLLTDSVMRLKMVDNVTLYKDFLLPRRSLYIMSGVARYNYNHEILKNEESFFKGQHILKGRRISVICRCQPQRDV
ncbi:alpha-ketoglutarate-dependent dioxygenase alkB homolog 7, mitochondrial isoform X1 [Bombus pyrosoma]|uniref:alpha-ketoglutarate-dependent dioxygenase alkB homolog 7, mitochondrial isoform X1 n=2 Tax=Bombus pyrosoma TaxID=396416 RepID=UPI001CB906B6|nr:alpha-ketoglutarate-dependent dioxygenase alkB homolog 7, mitochondrial isoform X1 [Bombus pyrosoma]